MRHFKIAALPALLALCLAPAGAQELEPVGIRLAWLSNWQHAGVFVAQALGYYAEAGLDVTINPGGPTLALNPAQEVLSGSSQFGFDDGGSLVSNRANSDAPVIAVAASFQEQPFAFITLHGAAWQRVRGDAPEITSVRQWPDGCPWRPGGRCKVGLALFEKFVLDAMLAFHGLTDADIDFEGRGADLSPLVRGDLDVYLAFGPNEVITLALLPPPEGPVETNLIRAADNGYAAYNTVLFTLESTVNSRADLVQKVVDTTLRGWRYAATNPEEAVLIVAGAVPAFNDADGREFLRRQAAGFIPLLTAGVGITGIGTMRAEVWQQTIDTLVRFGVIDALFPAEEIFTTQFLGAAL